MNILLAKLCQCFTHVMRRLSCVSVEDSCINASCSHTCRPNRDTEGSYQCWCRPGYKEINQVECEDIDECTNSGHDCEQVCLNTIGSFLCSCNDTYRLGPDGKHCVDYIKCVSDDDHTCDELHMVCVNDAGGYHCVCSSGFTHDGNRCQDVDECASGDHDCDQVCQNTQGGFICSCEEGYERTDGACTGQYVIMLYV